MGDETMCKECGSKDVFLNESGTYCRECGSFDEL